MNDSGTLPPLHPDELAALNTELLRDRDRRRKLFEECKQRRDRKAKRKAQRVARRKNRGS